MLKTLVTAVALASLAAVAVLAVWSASDGTGEVSAATAVDIGIDMDTAGNDARLTGGADIQNCAQITGTNTIKFDVILPPPGVDANGIKAYQFDLLYDPAVVNVTAENKNLLLNAATDSLVFSLSDPLPDSDGSFTSAAADIGSPPDPEPSGISEVGPGVITRITLTGVAPGTSPLVLSNIIPADATGNQIPINNLFQATVSVDEACVPTTPTPTLTVEKVVVNDDGGMAVVGDFTLRVDGGIVTSGVANSVSIGSHTISEDNLPGYTPTIGGDCDAAGNVTVGVGANENKTCTITNDDVLVAATPTPTPTPPPGPTPTPTGGGGGTPTPTPTGGGGGTPTPTPIGGGGGTPTPTATPIGGGGGTPTPTDTDTSTPTATPAAAGAATPAGGAAPRPGAAPPTGDGIPIDEEGGSVLLWLFVGLGAAMAAGATGYMIYGRTRGRLPR